MHPAPTWGITAPQTIVTEIAGHTTAYQTHARVGLGAYVDMYIFFHAYASRGSDTPPGVL